MYWILISNSIVVKLGFSKINILLMRAVPVRSTAVKYGFLTVNVNNVTTLTTFK